MISPIQKKARNRIQVITGEFFSIINFVALLDQRLMKFVIKNSILSNGQLGFLPGNRTPDAHFIVDNLIDLYCNKRKTTISCRFQHSQKKRYSVYYGFLLFMEINLKFIWRPAGGAWCKVKWLNQQGISTLVMIWMTCLCLLMVVILMGMLH